MNELSVRLDIELFPENLDNSCQIVRESILVFYFLFFLVFMGMVIVVSKNSNKGIEMTK